jgi:hypothetical protein
MTSATLSSKIQMTKNSAEPNPFRQALNNKGQMYLDEKLYSFSELSKVYQQFLNISSTNMDDPAAIQYTSTLKLLSEMIKDVIEKTSRIEIDLSFAEILSIIDSRKSILIWLVSLMALMNLILVFKIKADEEAKLKFSLISVIKIFKIFPRHIMFRNQSIYFLLQTIFENS